MSRHYLHIPIKSMTKVGVFHENARISHVAKINQSHVNLGKLYSQCLSVNMLRIKIYLSA